MVGSYPIVFRCFVKSRGWQSIETRQRLTAASWALAESPPSAHPRTCRITCWIGRPTPAYALSKQEYQRLLHVAMAGMVPPASE